MNKRQTERRGQSHFQVFPTIINIFMRVVKSDWNWVVSRYTCNRKKVGRGVGATVNVSFFCKCNLHKALLVSVAEIITWTLELQHNQFHTFRRKRNENESLNCKTCSNGYLGEIKSCLDHKIIKWPSRRELWSMSCYLKIAKIDSTSLQEAVRILAFDIWLLIKIPTPTIT